MHVLPAKHSYVPLTDRHTDRRTDSRLQNIAMHYYQESVTTVEAHTRTDRQTWDKRIPMWCYAKQATQKKSIERACHKDHACQKSMLYSLLLLRRYEPGLRFCDILFFDRLTDRETGEWVLIYYMYPPPPCFHNWGEQILFSWLFFTEKCKFWLVCRQTDKWNMKGLKAKSLLVQKLWLRWKFLVGMISTLGTFFLRVKMGRITI